MKVCLRTPRKKKTERKQGDFGSKIDRSRRHLALRYTSRFWILDPRSLRFWIHDHSSPILKDRTMTSRVTTIDHGSGSTMDHDRRTETSLSRRRPCNYRDKRSRASSEQPGEQPEEYVIWLSVINFNRASFDIDRLALSIAELIRTRKLCVRAQPGPCNYNSPL